MRDREAERLEEEEVLRNLPIYLVMGFLPMELQHLVHAIDRLNGRGVIKLLANGHGARWALVNPGDRQQAGG